MVRITLRWCYMIISSKFCCCITKPVVISGFSNKISHFLFGGNQFFCFLIWFQKALLDWGTCTSLQTVFNQSLTWLQVVTHRHHEVAEICLSVRSSWWGQQQKKGNPVPGTGSRAGRSCRGTVLNYLCFQTKCHMTWHLRCLLTRVCFFYILLCIRLPFGSVSLPQSYHDARHTDARHATGG